MRARGAVTTGGDRLGHSPEEAKSPEDDAESEPPEDEEPPSSPDRYTEGCFLLSRWCFGHAATAPERHFPLHKWLMATNVLLSKPPLYRV